MVEVAVVVLVEQEIMVALTVEEEAVMAGRSKHLRLDPDHIILQHTPTQRLQTTQIEDSRSRVVECLVERYTSFIRMLWKRHLDAGGSGEESEEGGEGGSGCVG